VVDGGGHVALDERFALGLQAAELIHGVFEAAVDALFVKSDVGDGVGGVEADAGGGVEVVLTLGHGWFVAVDRDHVGVEGLTAAVVEMVERGGFEGRGDYGGEGEHFGFDGGDAAETPVSVGNVAADFVFEERAGMERVDDAVDVECVGVAVVGRKQSGGAGEAVLPGVVAGARFAVDGTRAGGLFGV